MGLSLVSCLTWRLLGWCTKGQCCLVLVTSVVLGVTMRGHHASCDSPSTVCWHVIPQTASGKARADSSLAMSEQSGPAVPSCIHPVDCLRCKGTRFLVAQIPQEKSHPACLPVTRQTANARKEGHERTQKRPQPQQQNKHAYAPSARLA